MVAFGCRATAIIYFLMTALNPWLMICRATLCGETNTVAVPFCELYDRVEQEKEKDVKRLFQMQECLWHSDTE